MSGPRKYDQEFRERAVRMYIGSGWPSPGSPGGVAAVPDVHGLAKRVEDYRVGRPSPPIDGMEGIA